MARKRKTDEVKYLVVYNRAPRVNQFGLTRVQMVDRAGQIYQGWATVDSPAVAKPLFMVALLPRFDWAHWSIESVEQLPCIMPQSFVAEYFQKAHQHILADLQKGLERCRTIRAC